MYYSLVVFHVAFQDATKSLMSDEKMEEIRNLEKYYLERVENFKRHVSVLFGTFQGN